MQKGGLPPSIESFSGDGEKRPAVHVLTNPAQPRASSEPARVQSRQVAARLAVLETMGFAESIQPSAWRVRRDFESILRAMQRTIDRQKTLAAHGVLMSDERLPIEVLNWRQKPPLKAGFSFTEKMKHRAATT